PARCSRTRRWRSRSGCARARAGTRLRTLTLEGRRWLGRGCSTLELLRVHVDTGGDVVRSFFLVLNRDLRSLHRGETGRALLCASHFGLIVVTEFHLVGRRLDGEHPAFGVHVREFS